MASTAAAARAGRRGIGGAASSVLRSCSGRLPAARAGTTPAARRRLLLAPLSTIRSSHPALDTAASLRRLGDRPASTQTPLGGGLGMGAPPPRAHSSAATAAEEGAGEAAKVSFKEAMAQLAAFPEMAEAAKHRAEHRVARAVPLLERAVEVLDSSMGKGNVLAEAARFQLALDHLTAGDYQGAHDLLEGLVERVQPESNAMQDAVSVRLLLGGSALFRDRLSEAVDFAEEALAFCEKRADSYTELLSRCYGLAGVCDMYGGDWEDAYDRLQKAARMAGTAAWQCRSASTLGAFHLYTGKEGGAKEALAVWEETLQALEHPSEKAAAKESALAEAGLWLDVAMVSLGDVGGEGGAKMKDLAKAEEAASKALKLQETLLGPLDPRMGRTLAAIARHRHLVGQAVSAEGLYRSAIDLLSSPAAGACPQLRHTLWRTLNAYADLLGDWDRREREAEAVRARAKAVPLLRLSPMVPTSQMVFIEGGMPGEVDYYV